MAVKIDKEVLIKHHFWILTGAFFLMALIPLLVLATSVSARVGKEKTDYEKGVKKIKDMKNPKNQNWVDAYGKQEDLVTQKKNEVWKQAWGTQRDLMTFPDAMASTFRNLYFGEDLGSKETDYFERNRFRDEYKSQLKDFEKIVQPVNHKGEGAVQVKGGTDAWDAFLGWNRSFQHPPSKEDIWLAQEDLWVKRELLRVVRDANDSVARFKQVKAGGEAQAEKIDPLAEPVSFTNTANQATPAGKAKPAKIPDESNHKIFRNQNWELDLTLAKNEAGKYVLRGKLKNISDRRQILAETVFKVFLQDHSPDSSYALVSINGEPVAVEETIPIKDVVVLESVIVREISGVEQVLNWRSAPVKRIDSLVMGYFSSRTADRRLIGPRFITQAAAEANKGAEAAPPSGEGRGGRLGGAEGGAGGPGGSSGTTLSGLTIPRYIDANEQVRHMPVAMTLIVKEENIPDVLAAFTNSKLRIQVTQFHWQHYRGSIQPHAEETPGPAPTSQPVVQAPAAGPRGGGRFGEGREGGRGEATPQRGPVGAARRFAGSQEGMGSVAPQLQLGLGNQPGRGLFGNAPGGTGSQSVDQEEDMGLMEISIYGVASLYEKYPPKAAPADAAQPAQPARPKVD